MCKMASHIKGEPTEQAGRDSGRQAKGRDLKTRMRQEALGGVGGKWLNHMVVGGPPESEGQEGSPGTEKDRRGG